MFEELKCPKFDPITSKWFVPLKDESGYLNIACTIIHDSALRRDNLNQVYFHTEHAAHVAAAAYYLNNPDDKTYPYNKEWDICLDAMEPGCLSRQNPDTKSTVMEFI